MLGKLEDLRQVEAKYPALLFKQQLTAFLEKIYGMMRDNLKKEISPLLGLCIQVSLVVSSLHDMLFFNFPIFQALVLSMHAGFEGGSHNRITRNTKIRLLYPSTQQ